VVGRDLGERVVAVEIDARIADVRDDGVVVDEVERADGRAHAREFGPLGDGVDGRGDGGLQRLLGLGRRERVVEVQPVDGDAGCHVAARVPAHAVGDDEEVRAVARILVVGAHLPRVGDGGARPLEDHVAGLLPQLEGRRADLDRADEHRDGLATRSPSCQVPLVESRSCSIHWSPQRSRRAWWLEV
jgi:hypothetical protein